MASYLTTQRGKRLLKFENYYYSFHYTKNITEYWRCRLRSCGGRVKIESEIVMVMKEHIILLL